MRIKIREYTVRELLDLYNNNMLYPNPEYQRGVVWKATQKKKLIDSVLRKYPLPIIYLHHIKKTVAGMQREDMEIIDGQQRINALDEFVAGAYRLFDPIKDDAVARFPRFLQNQPCPWGGKDFRSLEESLQTCILETELPVALIDSDDPNEVRDLFVRLQSGLPLNAQEKRDAYPGEFTDFILRIGGKPQITRYPGHDFFKRIMRMKPGQDRGKTRQLAAQIAMLFLTRHKDGPEKLTDINSTAIDEFYYSHIDFDASTSDSKRLIDILDKLSILLSDGKRPKLRAHDAIHLVLLVDSLWDDYTRQWEETLPKALDEFLQNLAQATASKDLPQPDEFWLRYGQWTRSNSDRGDRIRRRHEFYTDRMLSYLGPLQPLDTKRAFGRLEREVIYFRDKKECKQCGAEVGWSEAEIHHVHEYHDGGRTELKNGVLVHRHCHPKGTNAKILKSRLEGPTQK